MTALIELIGGAGVALALLGGVIGWMFASGAVHVWTATFGKMLVWLADHANFSVSKWGVTLGHDFGPIFRRANNDVYNYFVAWRTGAEIEIAWSIRTLRLIWQANAEAVDWLAKETAQAFDWLNHVRLTQILKAASAPVLLPLLLPKLLKAVLPHIKQGTVTTIRAVTHEITHATTQVVTRVVRTAVAFPPWVIRLPGRVGHVERDLSKLNRRLLKVEAFAAAGVFAALLANALGVSLRCVRRGNVGKAARSACGADTGLFDSLLFDLLAIAGVISVVEFAHGLLAIEDEAVAILGAGIREFPG